jgi:hypothetical protein
MHDFEKVNNWYKRTYKAIHDAGGAPSIVVEMLPEQLLNTMIQNNLYIVFERQEDVEKKIEIAEIKKKENIPMTVD